MSWVPHLSHPGSELHWIQVNKLYRYSECPERFHLSSQTRFAISSRCYNPIRRRWHWCTHRDTLTNSRRTHRNTHIPENSVAEQFCCLNRCLGGFESHGMKIKLAANLCGSLTDIGLQRLIQMLIAAYGKSNEK